VNAGPFVLGTYEHSLYFFEKQLTKLYMQKNRQNLVLSITIVLVGVITAILVLFSVQSWNIRQEVIASKVLEATEAVRDKFLELSTPIYRDLSVIAKWGESGSLDTSDTRLLNDKFIPMLESQTIVSSLIIADTDGNEYFLLRENQSWLTRSAKSYRPGMEVILNRWNTGGDLLETLKEKRTFDPRSRNWFAGALQLPDSGSIFWTEPYLFKTTSKLGITASVRWQAKSAARLIAVAAMDISLDDLYRFLAGLHVTPGSRVLLIREDGTVMSPRNADLKSNAEHPENVSFIRPANFKESLLRDAIDLWDRSRTELFAIKSFSSEGKTWWAGFKHLQSERPDTWVGSIIPQEDLAGNLRQSWIHTVLTGAAILLAGSVLIIFLIRRMSQEYSIQPAANGQVGITERNLLNMIATGESSNLEFKSTLRTNLKTGKTDKAIELACLKSMVAFMNSEGGTLLIGVNDDRCIDGIKADAFENHDKCLLHVKNLINQHIGAEFSQHIDCDLKIVDGKTIVVITCEKAANPVFLKVGKNEDFFIRSGPSSVRLSMSQMVKYLEQRKD
jgi:hypothetical protein